MDQKICYTTLILEITPIQEVNESVKPEIHSYSSVDPCASYDEIEITPITPEVGIRSAHGWISKRKKM